MSPVEVHFKSEMWQPRLSTNNSGVHERAARGGRTHVIHHCFCISTSPSPAPQQVIRAIWEIPHDPLMHEKTIKLGSQLSLVWEWKVKKNGGNNTTSLRGVLDRQWWLDIFPKGRALGSLQGHPIYVKRKVTQGKSIMDLWAVVRTWLISQGPEKRRIGISGTRSSRKEGLLVL